MLRNKAKESESSCSALDMSDDTSDIAQLSIAARGTTESSEVAEEIVSQSLHGTTAGENFFMTVSVKP
jgi:hypothetical protein